MKASRLTCAHVMCVYLHSAPLLCVCVCVCMRVRKREGERRLKWVSAYFHFRFHLRTEYCNPDWSVNKADRFFVSLWALRTTREGTKDQGTAALLSESYFQMDTSDTRKRSDNGWMDEWMDGWLDGLLGSWLIFIHSSFKKKYFSYSCDLKTFYLKLVNRFPVNYRCSVD